GGAGWLGFEIDWSTTGLDPLNAADLARLGAAWRFESPYSSEGLSWKPQGQSREALVALLVAGTGIDATVAEQGAPPELVVESLVPAEGELKNGVPARLTLTVANRGQGPAYR